MDNFDFMFIMVMFSFFTTIALTMILEARITKLESRLRNKYVDQ